MAKVKFIKVGRQNSTWEAELPDAEEATIAKEASNALMSSGNTCHGGTVFAGGWRAVGKYEVIDGVS